jgi:hypothetical protein
MKEYPSIPTIPKSVHIYAFDKLDGSNIRAEWDSKKGFHKFGKRHGLLDSSNKILLKAPELIRSVYGESLAQIFDENKVKETLCFFEFHGPNSFAGQHDENDNHTVTLFDCSIPRKGILHPRDFLTMFKTVPHAECLMMGQYTPELQEQVRAGVLPGMTFEGIVCKGNHISPGMPLMFKIKNLAWIEKLRFFCKGNEQLYKSLL